MATFILSRLRKIVSEDLISASIASCRPSGICRFPCGDARDVARRVVGATIGKRRRVGLIVAHLTVAARSGS
ncbi:hypothetical protein [Gordonia sp. NPDC003376]